MEQHAKKEGSLVNNDLGRLLIMFWFYFDLNTEILLEWKRKGAHAVCKEKLRTGLHGLAQNIKAELTI